MSHQAGDLYFLLPFPGKKKRLIAHCPEETRRYLIEFEPNSPLVLLVNHEDPEDQTTWLPFMSSIGIVYAALGHVINAF